MAPPNLSGGHPLDENLTPPPQTRRNAGEHGPHSVISTYSKKDAVLEHADVTNPPSSPKTSVSTERTSTVGNIPENPTETPGSISESPMFQEPFKTAAKNESGKLERSDQSWKGELMGAKDDTSPTSDEDESMEDSVDDETVRLTTISPSGAEGVALLTTTTTNTKEIEPAELKSLALFRQGVPSIPIQPIQTRVIDSPLQAESSFMVRTHDPRNPSMAQSFNPYDYNRMGYQQHPSPSMFGYPTPIVRNGFIYYPSLPRPQLPLAREISNRPVLQIAPSERRDEKFDSNEPTTKKVEATEELPVVTTYRPRPKSRPTFKTKSPSDQGIALNSRSQVKRAHGSSTTGKPSRETNQIGNPFPYEDKFDLVHFEEELADFSNLYHHQKSLEELARNGKDVAVREDDWLVSGEGATAVILVGMCSIIMMLICFIFVIKRLRKKDKGGGGKVSDEIEEIKQQEKSQSMWLDLYNPVNLIPQISYLHTLPHVDIPSEKQGSEPSTSSASTSSLKVPNLGLPMPPFVKVEKFTETHLGRIWFTVRYDTDKSSLHVNIRHARYPKGREISSNTGEMWVEGRVLSSMNTILATSKTSTRRATPSPVFNHSFLFLIEGQDTSKCLLKLIMHDRHPKKGEEVVGSIILPLSSIDLSSNELLCRDLL